MIIEVSENIGLTLDEIKFIESVCRKQRKRLNSNTGKCDKTIDMFEIDNLGESDE